MPFIPKVGIIACNGEECGCGNISRQAALKVLHELRPHDTVTICLPLFLAGDSGERGFAEVFPTVTIDGCNKLCATRGTAMYSSEPAVSINVQEYVSDGCAAEDERWVVTESRAVVDRIAEEVAAHVDRLRARLAEEWT